MRILLGLIISISTCCYCMFVAMHHKIGVSPYAITRVMVNDKMVCLTGNRTGLKYYRDIQDKYTVIVS